MDEEVHVVRDVPIDERPSDSGAEPACTTTQPVPAFVDSLPAAPGKGRRNLTPLVCQIQGCGEDLTGSKPYFQRYRVCPKHLKASTVLRNGTEQRFCQQCGRFHPVGDFDGSKRNCRMRLAAHNTRRRRGKNSPDLSPPRVPSPHPSVPVMTNPLQETCGLDATGAHSKVAVVRAALDGQFGNTPVAWQPQALQEAAQYLARPPPSASTAASAELLTTLLSLLNGNAPASTHAPPLPPTQHDHASEHTLAPDMVLQMLAQNLGQPSLGQPSLGQTLGRHEPPLPSTYPSPAHQATHQAIAALRGVVRDAPGSAPSSSADTLKRHSLPAPVAAASSYVTAQASSSLPTLPAVPPMDSILLELAAVAAPHLLHPRPPPQQPSIPNHPMLSDTKPHALEHHALEHHVHPQQQQAVNTTGGMQAMLLDLMSHVYTNGTPSGSPSVEQEHQWGGVLGGRGEGGVTVQQLVAAMAAAAAQQPQQQPPLSPDGAPSRSW